MALESLERDGGTEEFRNGTELMEKDQILLAHGSGGRLTHELVRTLFREAFANPSLDRMEDAAVLSGMPGRIALTTDSYVVQPLFFPGGDIGKLAVCGTVNDLAMVGAQPRYLTAGFILEEGLALEDLRRVVSSMAGAARQAGVAIVSGDTKVVGRGNADKLFINTAGIGWIPEGVDLSPRQVRAGDRILVSGTLGDHGMAILCQREGLRFESALESDCAPLNGLVEILMKGHSGVRVMRDPTRGGLATTLVELAQGSGCGFEIEESRVPVRETVRSVCELLGFDPLYVANEGKLIAIVPDDEAEACLSAMKSHSLGEDAALIGRVVETHPGKVVLRTPLGVSRLLEMLSGEQLPRIC
jgi:hydrogenase expression/formation protein HypE